MLDQNRFSIYAPRLYLAPGALVLLAWAMLAIWQASPYASLLGHAGLGEAAYPPVVRLAAFLAGWLLMTAAMMLPASLPQLAAALHPAWQQRDLARRLVPVLLGYAAPWVLFGLLFYLGDSLLHRLAAPAAPLESLSDWITPAVILVAGVYQFTPGKQNSLRRCRPALTTDHRRRAGGDHAGAGDLQQGLALGSACVAGCWSLMLFMSAVGHSQPAWMLVLGGVIAGERLAPWGGRMARLVGLALILSGLLWAGAALYGGHAHLDFLPFLSLDAH